MQTNEKIREIALKLFASEGYEGASTEKIAREVGIRKSSLYFHFKTKEDLYLSIFEYILNLDITAIESLIEQIKDYSTKEKLKAIFDYYTNLYIVQADRDEVMFLKRALLFPPTFLKEKLQVKFEEYENILNMILIAIFENGFIDKTIKKIDIKDLLAMFYCLIDGLFFEANLYSRKEYSSRADSIWNFYWSGISLSEKEG